MSTPIKESIKTIHKIIMTGTLDVENLTIQPEDEDEKDLKKLIKRFDGDFVKITITNETETEVTESDEEE